MKIKKVSIEGFGLFHDVHDFEFSSDRINLIVGNNETGKTTLLRAIIAVFFGLERSRWALYRSRKDAKNHFASVEFSEADEQYSLHRDFEENEVIFSKTNKEGKNEVLFKGKASPQSRTEEKELYYESLQKVIGLNNEAVFRNVNVVYQRSIEMDINKEIQHILTGAVGTNYKTVLERWIKEYFSISRSSAWPQFQDRRTDKQIDILEQELKDLELKKENIIEKSIKATDIEDEIKEMEKELKDIDEENKSKSEEFELSKEVLDLLKEKSNHEEKIVYFNNEIEKYRQIKAKVQVKHDLIEQNYNDFKDISDDIIDNMKNAGILEAELKEKKEELNNFRKSNPSRIKSILLGINGLVLAGLVFFARMKFNKEFLLYISLVIGALSLFYLIFSLYKEYIGRLQYRTLVHTKDHMIRELEEKLKTVQGRLKDFADTQINKEYLNKYDEYKKIVQDKSSLEYTLQTLSDVKQYTEKKESSQKELISINTHLKELEKRNPALTALKEDLSGSVEYVQKLKQQIRIHSEKIESLKKNIYKLNKELSSSYEESESIASINYKINEIKYDFEKLHTFKGSYIMAVNTLKEAIKEYQEKHIERLSKNISEHYSRITDGAHRKVILNEEFSPLVEGEDNENIRNLSCGAEEQLYFAVRMSLLQEINDLTKLPLLLDDPFVNFDKDRLEEVKKILDSIVADNQIIIFSHIKSYSKWDNIHLIKM